VVAAYVGRGLPRLGIIRALDFGSFDKLACDAKLKLLKGIDRSIEKRRGLLSGQDAALNGVLDVAAKRDFFEYRGPTCAVGLNASLLRTLLPLVGLSTCLAGFGLADRLSILVPVDLALAALLSIPESVGHSVHPTTRSAYIEAARR
jgi:hypothetical protein